MTDPDIEARIQQLLDDEAHAEAVTLALEAYAPGILGYLMAMARDEDVAKDVFSQFAENLWLNIESYRARSSFRAWAYTIARNAFHRYHRGPVVKKMRRASTVEVQQLEARLVRSTLSRWRSEARDRFTQLREKLDEDDQTLLILRIDRDMRWSDVAEVMFEGEDPTDDDLKAFAATQRKRFERVKKRLRKLAEEEGLLEGMPESRGPG